MDGGMTTPKEAYGIYLQSEGWRQRRDEAVAQAKGRCQLCNSSKHLNVHHRTYERLGRERAANLTVLCRACHEHFHGVTGGASRRLSAAPEKKPGLRKRTLAALRTAEGGELTIKQLHERTGGSRNELRKILHALVKSRVAYEVKPGYWIPRYKEKRLKPEPVRRATEIKPWDKFSIRAEKAAGMK